MKIERKYQIHLAASKDDDRITLKQVFISRLFTDEGEAVQRLVELNKSYQNGIKRPDWYEEWPREPIEFLPDSPACNGVAFASDGWILSAVPVELEPDDITGPVSAALMEKAFKLKKKEIVMGHHDYSEYVHMQLGLDTIRLGDGATHGRITDLKQFPNFFPLVTEIMRTLNDDSEEVERWIPFLDINNMLRTAKTIGVDVRPSVRGSGISMIAGLSDSNAVFVKNQVTPLNMLDMMKVPFGIIMPMHYGR